MQSVVADAGLAPDGGLYVPESFPLLSPADFDGADTFAQIAARFLAPFLVGDVLRVQLEVICHDAFRFNLPLARLGPQAHVLELYWGPTAAFKDIGASFLAECIQRRISSIGDTHAHGRTVRSGALTRIASSARHSG